MNDATSEPRTCEVCGKPLYRNNKTGICSGGGGTAACKRARIKNRSRSRKSRAVPESARESCAVCGSKLRSDNRVGVCAKTPECCEEMARRRRTAQQNPLPARRAPTRRPRRVPAIPARTVFERWTTLEESPKGGDLKVLCRCRCGNEVRVDIGSLRRGVTKSCGCLKRERCGRWPRSQGPYLPAGYVSGRITTLEDAAKAADDVRIRCECGNETVKNAQRIKSGVIGSCNCLVGEILRTHGLSGHPLYSIWRGIVNRGSNPGSRDYWKYGAIGRTTCEGYRTAPGGLLRFAEDMGPRPGRGYSTDRLLNTGGYWCGRCPECVGNGWPLNVAWRTRSEQTQNRDCLAKVIILTAEVERLSRPAAPRGRKPSTPAQGALF